LDLFGRRQPIRLPDDDDDDDDEVETGREEGEGGERGRQQESRKREGRRRQPPPTISSSTLKLDTAPDSAAIASHAEEEAARSARRAHWRERKERKRAALAFALEYAAVLDGVVEFEGFPGRVNQHRAAASVAEAAVSLHVRVRNGANVPYSGDDEDEDLEEDSSSNLCCNSRLDFITSPSPRWQTCSRTCRRVFQSWKTARCHKLCAPQVKATEGDHFDDEKDLSSSTS